MVLRKNSEFRPLPGFLGQDGNDITDYLKTLPFYRPRGGKKNLELTAAAILDRSGCPIDPIYESLHETSCSLAEIKETIAYLERTGESLDALKRLESARKHLEEYLPHVDTENESANRLHVYMAHMNISETLRLLLNGESMSVKNKKLTGNENTMSKIKELFDSELEKLRTETPDSRFKTYASLSKREGVETYLERMRNLLEDVYVLDEDPQKTARSLAKAYIQAEKLEATEELEGSGKELMEKIKTYVETNNDDDMESILGKIAVCAARKQKFDYVKQLEAKLEADYKKAPEPVKDFQFEEIDLSPKDDLEQDFPLEPAKPVEGPAESLKEPEAEPELDPEDRPVEGIKIKTTYNPRLKNPKKR